MGAGAWMQRFTIFFRRLLRRCGMHACSVDKTHADTGRMPVQEDEQSSRASSLLVAIARGDKAAFGELFRQEAGRLLAVARRIVRRADLAEEVVQEAFVTAWRMAPSFDAARGSGRVWLSTIVRNRALNLIRDGKRLELHDAPTLERLGDASGDADQLYRLVPEADTLKQCLDRLENERRQCILLAYVAGFTHGEIAARIDRPVGTVKAWIRRGMVTLQECMS